MEPKALMCINLFVFQLFVVLDVDFNVSSLFVEIPPGTMGPTILDYDVTIIEDDDVEGDHSFFINIAGNESFTTGDIDTTKVIIIDDDSKWSIV